MYVIFLRGGIDNFQGSNSCNRTCNLAAESILTTVIDAIVIHACVQWEAGAHANMISLSLSLSRICSIIVKRVVSKRAVLADVRWTPKTGMKVQKNGTMVPKPERGYKKPE